MARSALCIFCIFLFLEAVSELDEETRRMVLFQFKMEIEDYYNKNYLTQEYKLDKLISSINKNARKRCHINIEYEESFTVTSACDFRNVVAIPGKKWQILDKLFEGSRPGILRWM